MLEVFLEHVEVTMLAFDGFVRAVLEVLGQSQRKKSGAAIVWALDDSKLAF